VSELYPWLKWLHVLSAAVLLGTGAGIAFFFVRAHQTRDIRVIAAVTRDVVLADAIFTATAVVLQPLTGLAMAGIAGYPVSALWIRASLALYCLIGACWLPVLWLQLRMRNLAQRAVSDGSELTPHYLRLYRWWFGLGWPAFLGVLVIFYLMIAKPF
jgi:uncharacterized membrane protein